MHCTWRFQAQVRMGKHRRYRKGALVCVVLPPSMLPCLPILLCLPSFLKFSSLAPFLLLKMPGVGCRVVAIHVVLILHYACSRVHGRVHCRRAGLVT